MDNILSNIYFNPNHPASFGGLYKLYKYAKLYLKNVTLKDVKNWLSKQNVYTLHKPIKRHFLRNKIYVSYIDEQWECDLLDMRQYSRQNNGINYVLTIIDCFSKYAIARPLKSKTALELLKVFKKIFKNRKPQKLRSDKGGEFDNKYFKKFCLTNDINYFTTQNHDIKCAIVERFNRTLKSKLFRYFTLNGTRKYNDVLQQIIDSYNNSIHRSIGMTPNDVKPENEQIVFENLYNTPNLERFIKGSKVKQLNIGDSVRRKYELSSFDKSYYPLWTDMVYKIDKVFNKYNKPQYSIEIDGEKINRRFYPEELQKVTVDRETLYFVEKKLQYRIRNGQRQVLVKWKGYPSRFNQWIPLDHVQNL